MHSASRACERPASRACTRPARAMLTALCLAAAIGLPPRSAAQPTETRAAPSSPADAVIEAGAATVRFPGARASLETSRPSIGVDEPFGFRVRVNASDSATRAWIRFRLRRSTGRLVFQRTRVLPLESPGSAETFFERETADLGLKPGSYPVEVDVSISDGTTQRDARLATRLLVFDRTSPRLPIVFVARVSGQTLSDPQGRYAADPGRFTRARDDAHALATWVLENPDAKLTLSIPPLLIEEWQRISDGYEFASPEGVERVSADEAVPRRYREVIETISRATRTGRLELVSTGYADPSLPDISAAGMAADVLTQYEQGLSATFASLETTPSTGTVPADGCIPADAVTSLVRAGVRYAVIAASCTRTGDSTAAPTSHRSKPPGLTVLVADETLSAAAASGDTSAVVGLAFARAIDDGIFGPLVISSEFGPGGADVHAFTRAADTLASMPWTGLRTGAAAVSPTKRTARLLAAKKAMGAPAGYWQDVNAGRRWADALLSAVGEGAADAVTARRDSLIAQASAWAGPDGTWAAAERGRMFAATARRLADATLRSVSLSVMPVTLSGASGNVPVTIRNAAERPLNVRVRARASGGARLAGARDQTMTLAPAETFTEIPVDLSQAVSGRLTVDVIAGDVVLDSKTVDIRASYLDRIATVGGIVFVLGALLAFIIRRVTTAERKDSSRDATSAYTDARRSVPLGSSAFSRRGGESDADDTKGVR